MNINNGCNNRLRVTTPFAFLSFLTALSAVCCSQAGRRLEVLYSEKGGVPVLFTSPYYVQLMDEVS